MNNRTIHFCQSSEAHYWSWLPIMSIKYRAVRRSENPGVRVFFGGHNLSPLVEIWLTDLPLAPPGTTPLKYISTCSTIYQISSNVSNSAHLDSSHFNILIFQPNVWNGKEEGRSAEAYGGTVQIKEKEGLYDTWEEEETEGMSKVIYTKYSKHWPYTLAHTIDCVCSKMLMLMV